MKAKQLKDIISNLDDSKRLKFEHGNSSLPINAILEHGGTYIFIWACHPQLIFENIKEGQQLIYYNENCPNYKLVKNYFPYYKNL